MEDINNTKKLLEQELSTGGTLTGSPISDKRPRLRKWRRIPRELVTINKQTKTSLKGDLVILSNAGDGGDYASREDSGSSEGQGSLYGGNLVVHDDDDDDDDQERIGRVDPGKKPRGFKMESNSEFLFVQGTNTNDNTVTSKGSGVFAEEEEEAGISFIRSDDDGSQEEKEDNSRKDDNVLVQSIESLDSAQEEFAREVQKWKDVGNNLTSIFDDLIPHMLKRKYAKILELESALTSEGAKTEFEDHLKKRIQAEVEYITITTKTESLTSDFSREIKQNLQQENVSSQDLQKLPKKQAVKLVTTEGVKKMENRVCIFASYFMIQLVLLLVILYLKYVSQNVEIVPT